MSEEVSIMGIDPGLRFTGYGTVSYNTETGEIGAYNCGLLKNPTKFKGVDAILNMMDLFQEHSEKEIFKDVEKIVVEIPAAIYFHKFSSGALLPVATIAGCVLSKLERHKIIPVYPSNWNTGKRKEKTHAKTLEILGELTDWHFDYLPKVQSQMEHIYDAVSMALWYLKLNYIDD